MKWFERLGDKPEPRLQGKIILLNGTSSSGKTSLAHALQKLYWERDETLYLHYALDDFGDMALPVLSSDDAVARELPRLVYAFNATVPVVVSRGNNLIVDHVLQEKDWVQDFKRETQELAVVSIGVHCSLEVVEKREQERQDRTEGLAKYQFDRVHAHMTYDIEIDTSSGTSEVNAQVLFEQLNK